MSDIVIVAIPEEDDPVWKVSSEKIPHLTLLYMKGPFDNEANTIQYIQHVVNTSMHRFGLSVDRRGTLGPDNADVLFFDKEFGGKELIAARAFFLANQDILAAYKRAEQYPVFTPHLTLGYPETPAHPKKNDYDLHWISFDRIAVWVGDFEGPEFVLPKNSDRALSAEWSFKDSCEYFAHKFNEASVKRDGKGQFSSFVGNILDSAGNQIDLAQYKLATLLGIYDPSLDETTVNTLPDGTTEETRTIIYGDGTQMDMIKKKDWNGKIIDHKVKTTDANGKRINLPIDVSALEKAVNKAAKASKQQNFNSKTKLDTSQITTTPGKKDNELVRLYKHRNDVVNLLKNKIGFGSKYEGGNQRQTDNFKKRVRNSLNPNSAKHFDESESVDDVLMHFGVRGMRWGVRRAVGPSGLVTGTVAGAIKSGQHPSAHAPSSAPVTKGKKAAAGQSHSEDHQKMVENLHKKVEDLSTAEIKQITQRLKALNDFKTASEAEKAAKASLGKKLTGWALNQVKEGAKQATGQWIKDQTGGTLKRVLPDLTKAKQAGEKQAQKESKKKKTKVNAEFIQTKTASSSTKPTNDRQLAIETLATQIQRLPKDKED